MKTLSKNEMRTAVESLIANGAVVKNYAKFARIQAIEAVGGEVIETILADGTKETSKPTGGVQKFLELDEDTKFICSWDEEQFIAKGGFVNVSDLSDIYGIARGEFFDTYKECDAEGNFLN